MSGAYRGEAKTDARDAYVIADTARLRRDFSSIDVPAQLVADLALLTAHRSDLIADRVRMLNRLRDVLTGIFPALERAFDYAEHKGALILLTGCQTPVAIRRRAQARLATWLAGRNVRNPDSVAATALQAAKAQHTTLPGQDVAAAIVADIAAQVLALDDRLKHIDQQIRQTFRTYPQVNIIESLPGMGPILGAEFIVAAGDLAAYPDARHLASAAGLVPVPRDSGRRSGNLHRPQALQPTPAPGLLPVCPDQHHPRRPQPRLLLEEARRRLQTRPSRHRPRPPTRQRPLGPAPGRKALLHAATIGPPGLTRASVSCGRPRRPKPVSIGPERSARIAATIESARSVWEATHDTDTLQQWLKDHNCHGADAVLVTRGLLNCELAVAQRMFFAAPCRQAELEFHNQVMEGLQAASEDL